MNQPGRHTLTIGEREIEYFHYPAKNLSAPVLIILHGHDFAAAPASFRSENYHVVCPMDRFGVNRGGSWWLGEDGDFFWIEAMSKIVESLRQQGAGDVYFWGSSMGGWGALLHGYLNNAKAVYANIPQTVLLGSSYSEKGGMKKYFQNIFGSGDAAFNDIRNVIVDGRGKYFLCFNQLEKYDYFLEQGIGFISHLQAVGAKFYLEVRPLESHGKNHGIRESIELFEKYC
jgi:pimeloyl-ACP methyl ester carboxylesterase